MPTSEAPIAYDAAVIREFAKSLYARAEMLVIQHILTGGAFVGAAGHFYDGARRPGAFLAVGFLIGAVLGLFIALPKAASLKLQAQMALCQVKIEENTSRRPAA
jgi:hypothetical protein